jgi:hypothetical protein
LLGIRRPNIVNLNRKYCTVTQVYNSVSSLAFGNYDTMSAYC